MRALLVLALLGSTAARAQSYVRVESDEPAAALLEEARSRGWRPVGERAAAPAPPDREALADLARAEGLVVDARRAAARLREGVALAALAEARSLVERHARVPGAARWLAEVELATGVVAHQQGRNALAEQSLVRAASLDPERTLGAAEAPPAVVERARELARAAATRPRTELTLRATVEGARAYLDDHDLGSLPLRTEIGVGRHVLRIEAPGHRVWGRVVDLTEGRHLPWEVALSPTPEEAERRRLVRASLAEVPAALRAGTSLLWIEAHGERALVTRCTTAGCAVPERREAGDALSDLPEGGLVGAGLRSRWEGERVWLLAEPAPVETPTGPRPWWRRGSTWVATALGAIVAGVALGFSLRPDVRQELRVVVDTEGL